jgi:thiosulfate reductase cytochrome b subunit
MRFSETGRVSWRVILVQLLILLGLALFYKSYLPHRARELAGREAAAREQKISALFRDSVEEDSTHEISVPQDGAIVKRHPQRLHATFSPSEAQSALGVPDVAATDFRGGQHLTWIGATHKLDAAFNAGHLYCLTFENRTTGHGVMVFESIRSWHPF